MADNPAPKPPFTDSPSTQPLVPPRPGSGVARFALIVAAASMVVAVFSTGLAVLALVRSGDESPTDSTAVAPQLASPGVKVATSAPQSLPSPVTSTSPAAPLDVLTVGATYTSRYSDQQLVPPVGPRSYAYLDLDEPRAYARNSDTTDVSMGQSSGSSVPFLDLQEVDGAIVPSGVTPDAAACAEFIRTAPVAASAQIPAQRNLVLCIATSRTQAAKLGIKQRMVVLSVVSLAANGQPTIKLSAWEIPG